MHIEPFGSGQIRLIRPPSSTSMRSTASLMTVCARLVRSTLPWPLGSEKSNAATLCLLFLKNFCSKNKKRKQNMKKKNTFSLRSHQNVHRNTETLRHDPGCERKDEPNLRKKSKLWLNTTKFCENSTTVTTLCRLEKYSILYSNSAIFFQPTYCKIFERWRTRFGQVLSMAGSRRSELYPDSKADTTRSTRFESQRKQY